MVINADSPILVMLLHLPAVFQVELYQIEEVEVQTFQILVETIIHELSEQDQTTCLINNTNQEVVVIIIIEEEVIILTIVAVGKITIHVEELIRIIFKVIVIIKIKEVIIKEETLEAIIEAVLKLEAIEVVEKITNLEVVLMATKALSLVN